VKHGLAQARIDGDDLDQPDEVRLDADTKGTCRQYSWMDEMDVMAMDG